jgi:tetratricopeptide (TPR) repeat protein
MAGYNGPKPGNKNIKNANARKGQIITGKPIEIKRRFSQTIKLSILLGLISFFVYANTLNNGFVLDDHIVIKDNHFVLKGISSVFQILTTPLLRGWAVLSNDLYRPLSLVMFALEYQFFGSSPFPYHLVNILIYAGCVIALFIFLNKFFERKRTGAAFIAALLFALHPIHTEVVANIKSADELLCFLFSFLCLNSLLNYMQRGKTAQLFSGIVCFFLALLSKETALTFLAVIPLIFFLYRNEHRKRSVIITINIIFIAVIYLAIRYAVLSYYHADSMSAIDLIENALANKNLSNESRIATAILILGHYVQLLLIPYPLSCDYSYNAIPYAHFSNFFVLLSLSFYIFLFILSIKRILNNSKDPYSFAILYFLITISIFSNIFLLIGATMAERFVFFSSAGFCLIVALLAEQLMIKTRAAGPYGVLKSKRMVVFLILTGSVYSFITISRNSDWIDNYTLYKTDLQKYPGDSRLNYYVADFLLQNTSFKSNGPVAQDENLDTIVHLLRRAISIYPKYVNAELDLGSAYYKYLLYDSAEYHYKRALQISPKEVLVDQSLAGLYFVTKKYRESITVNRALIEINPKNAITYANIGISYLRLSVNDSAIFYACKAISIDSSFYGPYQIISNAYKEEGQLDSANKYYILFRQKMQ